MVIPGTGSFENFRDTLFRLRDDTYGNSMLLTVRKTKRIIKVHRSGCGELPCME